MFWGKFGSWAIREGLLCTSDVCGRSINLISMCANPESVSGLEASGGLVYYVASQSNGVAANAETAKVRKCAAGWSGSKFHCISKIKNAGRRKNKT